VGLILAMIAVGMLAFAGTADAKKKKKKKVTPVVTATATATGTVQFQVITATATCPAGKNAVGGGFVTTPPVAPGSVDAGLASASHKVGANQWVASAQILGTPGPPVVLTTSVYCRKGASVTTPVSTPTSVPTFGGAGATPSNAACPAGQVQLSGGFTAELIFNAGGSLQEIPISSNRIDPLTWQASAITTSSPHVLTSQADCAAKPKAKKGKKKKKKKKLVTPTEVTGDAATSTPTQSVTAIATCPTKTFAVNGGFSQPGAVSPPTLFFYWLTESQAVGNAWHVTGFLGTGPGGTLRSYGYCLA